MAAKKVDIMEIRQLLLLKDKSESNRSCEKLQLNFINISVSVFLKLDEPHMDKKITS
jgi:hypothetical protein